MSSLALDRRAFVKTGAAAGVGLLIGLYIPASADDPAEQQEKKTPNPLNAWVHITPDNRITLILEKSEMGQGIMTAVPMILAEELCVDWKNVMVEQAPTNPEIYDHGTGGSGSVAGCWLPMRRAGAAAREMLISAAAARWGVDTNTCKAQDGGVMHGARNNFLTYGQLAEDAAKLPVPNLNTVALKNPNDFTIVGKTTPRFEGEAKTNGSAKFGIDSRVPGMQYAVIARCPIFGAKLKSFDATKAKQVAGVRDIFAIDPVATGAFSAGGVAVVADNSWAAIQGRKALQIQWDNGPHAGESSASLRKQMLDNASKPGKPFRNDGDADAAITSAAKKLEATYEFPFAPHATMEPMNSTVHIQKDRAEAWVPTQGPQWALDIIAGVSGLPKDKIAVHTTLMGGGFGRRYMADFVMEAAQVSKHTEKPVMVLWTREDDMQHDFYRPYNYQRLRADFNERGSLIAWSTRVVTTPIAATNLYTGFTESAAALKDPATIAALEWYGADIAPYSIPNFRLDYAAAASVVPRSWWRSVSSSYTLFAKECFVDELAHAIGRDPLQFRMDLLTDKSPETSRLRAVLELAAGNAGWNSPLPKAQGRGIACCIGGSYSAQVAEVRVDPDGTVNVLRVVSAVDCGIAVNPDGVRAMTEGAINFALTAVLSGEITIDGGAVKQSNFHDYPVLRINQAPEIEVHIVASDDQPSGVGELGAMLVAPAVANAVFAATGVRVRRLPIDRSLLKRPGS